MEAYVYDHVRTPRGKGRPDGALHEITSVEMARQLLEAVRDRNQLDTSLLDDVLIGMAQPAGEQGGVQIGRAHVCTPVTNAHLVCRLLRDKKKSYNSTHT